LGRPRWRFEWRRPVSEVRQNRGEWRQQQQSQQTPRAQPQRQWNGGGDRQRGDNRPQRQQATPQAVPQQSPQAVQQQQQQRWGGNRGDRSQWNNGGNRSQWTGNRSQWNGGTRGQDAGQQQQRQLDQQRQQQFRNNDRGRNDGDRGQYNRGNRNWNDSNRNNGWNDRNRGNGWNDNRNGGWNNNRDRGSWNNNWRSDRRYDWRGYRSSNRNVYRLPRYYAPNGWGYGYQRFGIGFTLNSILFSSSYWINDPYYYRLPEVDGPYRWVRYYNDALLVDIYSGEVVDTIYDIFW
jgi:hypothetical protein